jgi:uncharacterized protein (DUF1501 family)
MIYTIFAYKPDSDDYCSGCRIASYSSRFEFLNTEDKNKALRFIVDKMSQRMDSGEAGYDFAIIVDGHTLYNDLDGISDDALSDTWIEENPARDLMSEARAASECEVREAKEKAKAAEIHAKAVEEARKVAQKEKDDRAEFDRLKVKFGGVD